MTDIRTPKVPCVVGEDDMKISLKSDAEDGDPYGIRTYASRIQRGLPSHVKDARRFRRKVRCPGIYLLVGCEMIGSHV